MTLIALKDVAVTFGASLFSNLNLTINKNDRIRSRGSQWAGQVDPASVPGR